MTWPCLDLKSMMTLSCALSQPLILPKPQLRWRQYVPGASSLSLSVKAGERFSGRVTDNSSDSIGTYPSCGRSGVNATILADQGGTAVSAAPHHLGTQRDSSPY